MKSRISKEWIENILAKQLTDEQAEELLQEIEETVQRMLETGEITAAEGA